MKRRSFIAFVGLFLSGCCRRRNALTITSADDAELVRSDEWPGVPPTIEKSRKMCSDCYYSSAAEAGWQYDRCHHPDADYGSIVRNDETPRCCDMRFSESQCGRKAKWFKAAKDQPRPDWKAP